MYNIILTTCHLFSDSISDDEGSNAATDGSTLRTSPAEVGSGQGSESGGSTADSIGGVSGRSSVHGEQFHSSLQQNDADDSIGNGTKLPAVLNIGSERNNLLVDVKTADGISEEVATKKLQLLR